MLMMKKWLKSFAATVTRNRLSILIYHQVFDQKDPLRPSEPTAVEFDRQMRLVGKYLNPLPLCEAVRLLRAGALPGNSVAVTFDDGYRNNLQLAAPILARHGVPATFFIATGFRDTAMWNDQIIELVRARQGRILELERLGRGRFALDSPTAALDATSTLLGDLKYRPWRERRELTHALLADHQHEPARGMMMSEDEIRALHRQGFEVGGHTHEHPILAVEDSAEQRLQIEGNKTNLEAVIGAPLKGFAYPNGRPGTDFDQTSVNWVRKLGFSYAVTTEMGVSQPGTDPYRLHRFTPWDRHTGKFYLRLLYNAVTG